MNKISLINKEHLISVINFINNNSDEFNYFKNIGWNIKNIASQFSKDNNYSLGYFEDNNLVGVLIGDTIKNDKIKITKLAQGLPVGGEIESLDDGTLFSAFKNRSDLKSNSD